MGALRAKLLLILFVLAFAVPSFSGSIDLDFEIGAVPTGGAIAILGGGTNATGLDVPILVLTVSGDGAYDGTYQVTGPCMGAGCLDFDGVAKTITIDGAVPIFADLTTPMTLLSGAIGVLNVTPALGGGFDIRFNGSDGKNSTLMADLGMPARVSESFTSRERRSFERRIFFSTR